MDYSLGKVYIIEPVGDHTEGDIYIGSTCQPRLAMRLANHRSQYKRWKLEKGNNVSSHILFDRYGFKNCQIVLIESVNCTSKDELTSREAYHIRNSKCVNKNIPLRTNKEYYLDNRDVKLSYQKQYQIDNRDVILAKNNLYYAAHKNPCICQCGGKYNSNSGKNRHLNSKKHINYIETENNNISE
jgi:hypothetical protein